MHPAIAAVIERPEVTGYLRLEAAGSAITVKSRGREAFLTDGPFVESKEFLGGLVRSPSQPAG